jgi:TolB protein
MLPKKLVASFRLTVPLLAFSAGIRAADAAPLGPFADHGDIGGVHLPGNASFDPEKQIFTVESSGTNMWGDHDEFHLVWKKVSGDFIVQAQTDFVGPGADPHRKLGIIVRSSLDPKSPHVNACRHGDGLASFQYRRTEGATTEELRFDAKAPDVFEISRHGNTYTMSVAKFGDTYTAKSIGDVELGDTVYVGIYVCAHNNDAVEKAVFKNVRLIRPAKDDFKPYRDYIGSELELLDVTNGHRRIIHHVDDSMQAPNWTPDGKRLIYNHNGRMFSFDLGKRAVAGIDTKDQVRCNNDHALSFDGKQLGISSGEISTVFTLPISGGTPKQITKNNPSYLHGWSPDGKWLVYTGIRNGEPDIYRISVEGGEEHPLTDTKGLDDGSEYTPDGQWIYFNSDRTGRMQVWRMKADGSGQEQLTHDDFNNWFPHVSPDGRSIVFISYGPEISSSDHPFYKHVYFRQLPIDGGEPTVVAYVYGGQGSMNVNSWAPDNKTIAFVSNSDRL